MFHRLLLIPLLAAAGCATTSSVGESYDAAADATRYASGPVPMGRSSSSGYSSQVALVLRAEAECPGQSCTPSDYTVSITNEGSNEFAANFNQVVFTTPQGTVSFEPGSQTESSTSPTVFFNSGRGELVRIRVPADVFASFAASRSLSVRLGSLDYPISYDARRPLRRMLGDEE